MSYGYAVLNADACMILNACSDPLALNYCPGQLELHILMNNVSILKKWRDVHVRGN